MNKIFYIMISTLFLFNCSNQPKLTNEMTGTFIGLEPSSFMKVGNRQIEVPGSKWTITISSNKLSMIQISDGETITYNGQFLVTDDSDTHLDISGNLKDNKYDQSYTPTLTFNKQNGSWYKTGVGGSEGCVLKKNNNY